MGAAWAERPCATAECHALANGGGRACDACDSKGMSADWSRTRDAAWLAGKSIAEIEAIPLPDRHRRLVLIPGERQSSKQPERQ